MNSLSEQVCRTCAELKPISAYYRAPANKTGYNYECKVCVLEYQAMARRRFKEKYPNRMRELRLRSQYGLEIGGYDRLFEEQNGVCAICYRPPTPGRPLSVDHCHDTGMVRGLLCTKCNTGLGIFADSAEVVAGALEYLRRSESACS